MRKIILMLFLALVIKGYSQVPQYINYQAVARDGSGNIITTAIGIKFQIYQGTVGGTLAYEETTTASPSSSGIFTVHIGGGTPVSGTFSSINWASGPYFLQVNIDPAGGTSYSTVGSHQLVSVPYALYAERAASAPSPTVGYASGILSVGGNTVLVSSSNYTAGAGISITGGVISNTAPNQTVSIASGTNISVTGAYPSYTVSYTGASTSAPNTSVTGTGAATVTSAGTNTFNVAVATPTLVGAGSTTVSGTYPLFTITTPSASNTNWSILGNAGTVDGTNFLGTTDNAPLNFRVNNQKAGRVDTVGRTFLGFLAGNSNTDNAATAFGFKAMLANTTGSFNTAVGREAMYSNTIGFENVAVGYRSLFSNSSANYNTSVGAYALYLNTTGSLNSAFGNWTMRNNTTGNSNSGFGTDALFSNTTGSSNSAFGMGALRSNTTGSLNCAFGTGSMFMSSIASANTSMGYYSQYNNQIGDFNTSVGYYALYNNNSGLFSTAIGYHALRDNINGFSIGVGADALLSSTTGTANVAMGNATFSVNISGSNNTAVGHAAGQFNPGSGNVFLGFQAGQNETGSNKLYIANNGTTTPLVFGDFATTHVGFGTTSPGYKVTVLENAGTLSALYVSNISPTGSNLGHGIAGITNNTGTLAAGVYAENTGSGPAISANKSVSGGPAARFEIGTPGNSADVIFANNLGSGAVIHTKNGVTASANNLGVLVEEGHYGSMAPVTTTIGTTGCTACTTATMQTHSNDVAGTFGFSMTANYAAAFSYPITFIKVYRKKPVVIITPASIPAASSNYYITLLGGPGNYTGFTINFPVGISAGAGSPVYNYMIIEGSN